MRCCRASPTTRPRPCRPRRRRRPRRPQLRHLEPGTHRPRTDADARDHQRALRPQHPARPVQPDPARAPEISIGGIKVQKYSAFLREIVVPTNFNIMSVRAAARHRPDRLRPVAGVRGRSTPSSAATASSMTRIEGRDSRPPSSASSSASSSVIATEYEQAPGPASTRCSSATSAPRCSRSSPTSHRRARSWSRPSFAMEIGETSGSIHFCIPYSTLEPIRDVLYSTIQGDANEPDRRWVKLMKQPDPGGRGRARRRAGAGAGDGRAAARVQARRLHRARPATRRSQAKVAGVPVFDCHYGTSNGKYALKVDQLLTSSPTSWLGDQHAD